VPQQSPTKHSHFNLVPFGLNLVIHQVSYAKNPFKTVPLKENHVYRAFQIEGWRAYFDTKETE